MNKGRKQFDPTEAAEGAVSEGALNRATTAANALALRSGEVSDLYDDGNPYDRARVVHEAQFFMSQSAGAMLEAGKRLIVIQENEPHGDFARIVTEELGLAERSARRMMAAALKYLSPALKGATPRLLTLGKSKLYDLMLEDDDQIIQLGEGGTVAGLDLDDINSMSSSELRDTLRKARQDMAAKDRVIETKNKKLDRIAEEEATLRDAPLPAQEEEQLSLLRLDTVAAEGALQRMLASVDQVLDAPVTTATELAARHSLDYLVQRIVDACNERGLSVDLADRVTPIWADAMTPSADAANTTSRKAR